ncbi:MAG: FAD-binding protein, partial [Gemmatimonadota bacterium]|nr:FAD-binding protein [Gemmatimonadota bacterium]
MTTARDVAEQVIEAAARGVRLRVRGQGRWLDANRPVAADAALSLADCAGIVEYVPGDFVITVRAGTTLAEIAAAAAPHGQWLPLDPFGGDEGTIGATVATASCGPHAGAFGPARDHVLGVEFVTGTGDIVRGGGRVVKNVAGFDLVRLVTGAWGTLGAITEVTLRLRARPAAAETLALGLDEDPARIDALWRALRALETAPLACELVNGALAERLELPGGSVLLVRIGGNAELMRAQRAALAELGALRDISELVWLRLRAADPARAWSWRLSRRPSAFADTWTAARRAVDASGGGWVCGSPARGVVRCAVPAAA